MRLLAGQPANRPTGQPTNRPTGQPANRPTGFTLVELVIAMAILSVGLVGSMRVFPVGLRASAQSEMSSRAAIAAQRTIELLKLKPCDKLVEARQTLEDLTVTTRLGQPRGTQLVDPSRLKVVETTVEWTRDGRSRALTFVTYVRCVQT